MSGEGPGELVEGARFDDLALAGIGRAIEEQHPFQPRVDDPAAYLRLVASLAPKNVTVDDGVSLLDFFEALEDRDAARADGEEEDEPAPVRH